MFTRFIEAVKYIYKYVLNDESDWLLVHTEISGWHRMRGDEQIAEMKIHFHLYENIHGMRRVKVHHTDRALRLKGSHTQDTYYIVSVVPWLAGQRIAGIDSHARAKQQQVMDQLGGE